MRGGLSDTTATHTPLSSLRATHLYTPSGALGRLGGLSRNSGDTLFTASMTASSRRADADDRRCANVIAFTAERSFWLGGVDMDRGFPNNHHPAFGGRRVHGYDPLRLRCCSVAAVEPAALITIPM